jgi:hypothetical protein
MRSTMTLAIAVAVAGLFAFAAPSADAKKKPMNKQCMATTLAGAKTTFKCGAAEKCCWQPLLSKGMCVPANSICL